MSELSIFVDESGGQGGKSKYYILTLVFHDQKDDISSELELAAVKFANKEQSRTDEKMYGSARAFKNNYMKAIKRKRLIR